MVSIYNQPFACSISCKFQLISVDS